MYTLETVAGYILVARKSPMTNIEGGYNYIDPHPIIDRQLKSGGAYENVFFNERTNSYIKVQYTMDQFRRRVTAADKKGRDKFIAIFGCSYVFGWAVNDNETLPSRIAAHCREYVPYNYGIPGVATQHMYYHLLNGNMRDEIPEENGILIYFYAPFQNNRIIGGMPDFNVYIHKFPCYEIEEGSLVYKGSFREAHPWRSLVYDTLFKCNTMKAFNFYLPLHYSGKHWDTIAAQIVESKSLFQEQFPGCPMVVLLFDTRDKWNELEKRLVANDIVTVELYHLVQKDFWLRKMYPDGHPKPELYELMAKGIANELKL